MNKKAFTVIELMIALIILTLIITSLWKVFSSAQKNAKEITENHAINDEIERTLLKISDDIREANKITYPKPIERNELDSIKTDDDNNKLQFNKIDFNFSKKPSENDFMSREEVNYFVKKNEISKEYELYRESRLYANEDNNSISSPISEVIPKKPLLTGFDECIFYRIKNPDFPKEGHLYIKLKIKRKDKSKYESETLVVVKERGKEPHE